MLNFIKLFNPIYVVNYIVIKVNKFNPYIIPDKFILKAKFFFIFGKRLNLKSPVTYNEKLQWLKLYFRKPIMTKMVDKCEVKRYVSNIIGSEYIIPTLGVWDSFDKIDFDNLPKEFVLKTTHDSGGVVIVRDKLNFDRVKAKSIIDTSLKKDFYIMSREWPYKNVPRRIIAEKYMEDETGELRDYKFFCFEGNVKYLFIATDRQTFGEDTKFDFFDSDFNHLPFTNGHPNSHKEISKPQNFEKMKELAERLSQDFPHVRVDLYSINGQIYFGELTFFHFSGLVPFVPEVWDYKFGECLKLPKTK